MQDQSGPTRGGRVTGGRVDVGKPVGRLFHVADLVVVDASAKMAAIGLLALPPGRTTGVVGVGVDLAAGADDLQNLVQRMVLAGIDMATEGTAHHTWRGHVPDRQLSLLLSRPAVDAAHEIQARLGGNQLEHLLLVHLQHGCHRLLVVRQPVRGQANRLDGVLGAEGGRAAGSADQCHGGADDVHRLLCAPAKPARRGR